MSKSWNRWWHKRWRNANRKQYNENIRQWCIKHPEQKLAIDRRYREKHAYDLYLKQIEYKQNNKKKVNLAQRNRRKRLKARRIYQENMMIVAVTCILCDEIIIAKTVGRIYCDSCSSKICRTIPANVYFQIQNLPSFQTIPHELLVWKRIMELRTWLLVHHKRKPPHEGRVHR